MNYYNIYNPIADFCSLGILFVLYVVIKSSYYSKSRKNKWMKSAIFCLAFTIINNIFYMSLISTNNILYLPIIYILRCLVDSSLLGTLLIFSAYLISLCEKNKKVKNVLKIINISNFSIFTFLIFISQFTHFGLYIENNEMIHGGFFLDPFAIGYILFIGILFYELIRYRKNILAKAQNAMLIISLLSIGMMVYESIANETTYLCFTYVLPILIVYALFHSNSYDLETGTLDRNSLNELINDSKKNNSEFVMLSLNFIGNKNIDDFVIEINNELHHFYDRYFIKPFTFRVNERRFILICKGMKTGKKNKDIFELFNEDFYKLYKKYEMSFKLLKLNSTNLFKNTDNYIQYIKYCEDLMLDNTIKEVSTKNMNEFFKYKRILKTLKDINDKKDLNDERVLVYTQPIYDVKTDSVRSAESLMRLNLDGNIISPVEFIPIAEKNNLIHGLSLIIFNKVCKNMNELSEKYKIDRISVNFSIMELSSPNFLSDIEKIIKKNKIDYSKIGIELTESENLENDFDLKANILSKKGYKLYLDDFGTGYSNLERIMSIPFDIIKFDKSLLDNAIINEKFKVMTKALAKTYHDLGYTILVEGIERKKDGDFCKKELYATYLQGYYYSKPIPIEKLKNFLKEK